MRGRDRARIAALVVLLPQLLHASDPTGSAGAPPPNVIVAYCGYIGGDGMENPPLKMDVDALGHAYTVTTTFSAAATLPLVVGPDLTINGPADMLVIKVRPDGSGLVYAGFLGGTGGLGGSIIAVDGSGSAHVGGGTGQLPAQLPVLIGPDLTFNGGLGSPSSPNDTFVAGILPAGTGLSYCGYIGGASNEGSGSIATHGLDGAYVAGTTLSDEGSFPVAVGPDLTFNGGGAADAFVARLRDDRTGLDWAGYIGGTDMESPNGLAVDSQGGVHVGGSTRSDEGPGRFPVTVGPILTFGGANDGFVARVEPDGRALTYAGYVNGTHWDDGYDIDADALGAAHLVGRTDSAEADFPDVVGPDLTFNGDKDAYVVKVRPDGRGLAYAGYIGGSGHDAGWGIAVDPDGNALVGGSSLSDPPSFPVLGGPALVRAGGADAFLSRVRATGTDLIHSGYLGGAGSDVAWAAGVDPFGDAYISGSTYSDEITLPVVVGPDLTWNGNQDAFVAKLGATACAALPGVISGLLAVKAGLARDDVALSWQADLAANGYNVWEVAAKADIPIARQSNQPPARGIAGCAPTPAGSTTCNDAGGVSRAPALRFYQVRAFCDPLSEGP